MHQQEKKAQVIRNKHAVTHILQPLCQVSDCLLIAILSLGGLWVDKLTLSYMYITFCIAADVTKYFLTVQ